VLGHDVVAGVGVESQLEVFRYVACEGGAIVTWSVDCRRVSPGVTGAMDPQNAPRNPPKRTPPKIPPFPPGAPWRNKTLSTRYKTLSLFFDPPPLISL